MLELFSDVRTQCVIVNQFFDGILSGFNRRNLAQWHTHPRPQHPRPIPVARLVDALQQCAFG